MYYRLFVLKLLVIVDGKARATLEFIKVVTARSG